MATPKFTARDLASIRSTGRKLVEQQYDETYDGPETIMTSLGYVEVWPEGDDDASVTMNRVNYTLEQLERASKRRAEKNGASESLTPAEREALARFAADHGPQWKSKLLYQRANSTAFPMNHPVLYRMVNRIGPSAVNSLRVPKARSSSPNGRIPKMSGFSAIKRDKTFSVEHMEGDATGDDYGVFGGSTGFCYGTYSLRSDAEEKAASRLAKYCPKRRKGSK